jgi:aminoglycoside phosphotransferase (APT) family kinase protein
MAQTTSSLDIEQPEELLSYLRAQGHIGLDETPRIEVLAGGVSSRTVLVKRASGEAWVLKQSLDKLRVATDWFSDPQRIHCEALAMRWFNKLLPAGRVPTLMFEDHAAHVVAMQAVPQPHENWKKRMLAGGLAQHHAASFGRLLGQVHRLMYAHRDEVRPAFAACNFFESLRLEPYYRYTATQIVEAAGFLDALITDTLAHPLTLVHGDFSPKNILIYQDELILLDHEVAHWGDPAFDIGFSLTHLLCKGHHLVEQRGEFEAAAKVYWRSYVEELGEVEWGGMLEARAVRHTLGCLLARAAGRSQVEYLSAEAKQQQIAVVCELMQIPPITIPDVIEQFLVKV